MIHDATIFCFASEDWGTSPLSKTHLMRRFAAAGNRVFFIESVGLRRMRASGHDLKRAWTKVARTLCGARSVEENLLVSSPFVLPFHDSRIAGAINRFLLRRQMNHLSRKAAHARRILWIGIPTAAAVADLLPHDLLVYHCADKFAAYVEASLRPAIETLDDRLVRRADLVLTPSQDVLDDVRDRTPNARLLPHGVDLEHFGRALDDATPLPADLAAIPGPRIGFVGVVDEKWLDLPLLEWIARQRPGWSFVLVGALVNVDPARWAALPNVRWLGWRTYESLPGYCKGFAAGIIPFATSELTRKARPLKMKEYLASGLPVVSTVPPEAGYEGVVRHAPSYEGFLAALDEGVAAGPAAGRKARLAAVRSDSWDARAGEAGGWIEERMKELSRATRAALPPS